MGQIHPVLLSSDGIHPTGNLKSMHVSTSEKYLAEEFYNPGYISIFNLNSHEFVAMIDVSWEILTIGFRGDRIHILCFTGENHLQIVIDLNSMKIQNKKLMKIPKADTYQYAFKNDRNQLYCFSNGNYKIYDCESDSVTSTSSLKYDKVINDLHVFNSKNLQLYSILEDKTYELSVPPSFYDEEDIIFIHEKNYFITSMNKLLRGKLDSTDLEIELVKDDMFVNKILRGKLDSTDFEIELPQDFILDSKIDGIHVLKNGDILIHPYPDCDLLKFDGNHLVRIYSHEYTEPLAIHCSFSKQVILSKSRPFNYKIFNIETFQSIDFDITLVSNTFNTIFGDLDFQHYSFGFGISFEPCSINRDGTMLLLKHISGDYAVLCRITHNGTIIPIRGFIPKMVKGKSIKNILFIKQDNIVMIVDKKSYIIKDVFGKPKSFNINNLEPIKLDNHGVIIVGSTVGLFNVNIPNGIESSFVEANYHVYKDFQIVEKLTPRILIGSDDISKVPIHVSGHSDAFLLILIIAHFQREKNTSDDSEYTQLNEEATESKFHVGNTIRILPLPSMEFLEYYYDFPKSFYVNENDPRIVLLNQENISVRLKELYEAGIKEIEIENSSFMWVYDPDIFSTLKELHLKGLKISLITSHGLFLSFEEASKLILKLISEGENAKIDFLRQRIRVFSPRFEQTTSDQFLFEVAKYLFYLVFGTSMKYSINEAVDTLKMVQMRAPRLLDSEIDTIIDKIFFYMKTERPDIPYYKNMSEGAEYGNLNPPISDVSIWDKMGDVWKNKAEWSLIIKSFFS